LNTTLPSYRRQLEDVVTELASSVNDLHSNGFDLDGSPGKPFFTITGSPLAGLEVAITKPAEIAASASATSKLDGSIALRIAELSGKDADFSYRKFIVGLGVETQTAQRRAEIQQAITDRIDAYRDADSGVNIDEEMTNMVAYQQAYSAAARFLTAVDEIIDTLINRTGHVGR
jgi:flagellar hook-associated protein 1 FlgK